MPLASPYDERFLFEQIATGDHAAFANLFHHFNPRLFLFVKRITKSEAVSEEIVQEVFLKVWVNRTRLSTYDQPVSWLFLIASNLSMTHLRNTANEAIKHERACREQQYLSADKIITKVEDKELSVLVEEVIRQLPPRSQTVFRLSRQQGYSHSEIAEHLSISRNTVKHHLIVAAKFIRRQLQRSAFLFIGIILLHKFF